MAQLALKLSIDCDSHNYESYNNLGVLCIKKGNLEEAVYYLNIANKEGDQNFEAFFNQALI